MTVYFIAFKVLTVVKENFWKEAVSAEDDGL